MSELIQSKDWAATSLGDLRLWPQSFRTALSLCLDSPAVACVVWGPARIHLYNDHYRSFCGAMDPHALGRDFADCWREVWPSIRAAFERAFSGETALIENQLVPLNGDAEPREALLTFSFVPIRDETGGVGGVFVSIIDATSPVESKRAKEDREAFNYALSHDLRSPLRSLEEMARILFEDSSPDLPEDTRLFLNRVAQAAAKLGERTSGLLAFNRVTHQALTRQTVNVKALVNETVAKLCAGADDRRVDIVVGDLPELIGDPELIRQVFVNTLSNAFKFTRRVEHPRIEIGGRREESQLAYFIADNGAGFDMKYATRLFGLFQRLHSDAEFTGAGVGLALTRRIIERHGGSIRAEAKKAHGATFHFTLPILSVAPRRAA